MRRELTANVTYSSIKVDKYLHRKGLIASGVRIAKKVRVAEVPNISEYTPEKYLLSHCTIIAGVDVENNGYWIKPTHSKWVNDNGNAWTNEVLLKTYKTFIMAENYVEHVQRKDLSRGKILDAVAREVEDDEGVKTLYVDILVATHRKHKELCAAIESGKVKKMSMGCSVSHTQCSKCGKVFGEDQEECIHLRTELKTKFKDPNGVVRVVAELCGVPNVEDSNRFTESSWVGDPAFSGAHRRGTIGLSTEEGRPLEHVLSSTEIVHDMTARKRAASTGIQKKGRLRVVEALFRGMEKDND